MLMAVLVVARAAPAVALQGLVVEVAAQQAEALMVELVAVLVDMPVMVGVVAQVTVVRQIMELQDLAVVAVADILPGLMAVKLAAAV